MCLGLHLSAQSPKPEEGTKHTKKEMNAHPRLMMHDAGVWGFFRVNYSLVCPLK